MQTPDLVLTRLSSLHDRLWDDRRSLARWPGGAPDAFSVRESALGALLDIRAGSTTRAEAALDAVLGCQYREPGHPWDGTFRIGADDPPPRPGTAVEWIHYDPNWRQFLGCILAVIDELHGPALPGRLRARLRESVAYATRSEPPNRLPVWYTNPYLTQTWLAGRVAAQAGDDDLRAQAADRLATVEERFRRYGDLDEYNSPTYDGVDLMALALWVTFPPTPGYSRLGTELLAALGNRVSTLYHPALGAVCGPYVRSYGLRLADYVSLLGQWLLLGGAGQGMGQPVLPDALDETTAHVHDLYFFGLYSELARTVRPHLDPRPVENVRQHTQTYRTTRATSVLSPDAALGAETGRTHLFARDQYVPVTVHVKTDRGTSALGVMCGAPSTRVDAEVASDTRVGFEVSATGGDAPAIRVLTSDRPELAGTEVTAGPVRVVFSRPPSLPAGPAPARSGYEIRLTWPDGPVIGTADLT